MAHTPAPARPLDRLPITVVGTGNGAVAVNQRAVQRTVVVDDIAGIVGIVSTGRLRPHRVAGFIKADRGIQRFFCIREPIGLRDMGLINAVELGISNAVYAIGEDFSLCVVLADLPAVLDGCDLHSLLVSKGPGEHLHCPAHLFS